MNQLNARPPPPPPPPHQTDTFLNQYQVLSYCWFKVGLATYDGGPVLNQRRPNIFVFILLSHIFYLFIYLFFLGKELSMIF